jgi:glycerol-1-phosphate dehydrogenase [NAD(P)+]
MDIQYTYGTDALKKFTRYCTHNHLDKFMLIADRNTYGVLGKRVEQHLKEQGWDVKTLVFAEAEIAPDEIFITEALLEADQLERMYLAVGSGTITDITRIVSHRTRRPFISLPTAPSVDGFTSPSASLVIKNVKTSVPAQPPVAVFADSGTLTRAPQPLIAAGFGDILGKAIALADWKLGHMLWDEPYKESIASRVKRTLNACIDARDEIGRASDHGIKALMDGLIDSGFCMLDFGNSRPAAGAEHYMSHYLELKLLREGRPAILHGAKVGLCSVKVAGLYQRLRDTTITSIKACLQNSSLPDHAGEIEKIRTNFSPIADHLLIEQAPFLDLTETGWKSLKAKILANWNEIQSLAAGVPSPAQLREYIRQAGGAVEATDIGLSDAEVQEALENAHYLRNRFTICKLRYFLGW